jgi:outer membrane receptor protein involved in Fe transport
MQNRKKRLANSQGPRNQSYAGLSAIVFLGAAYAQDGIQGSDNSDDDRIVVTGSRIAKPYDAFSNPVLSIESAAIQQSGATNLVNFLKEIPALTASRDANDESGFNQTIGGAGVNLLDLRNLGVQRTLVLIDGRRHVGARPGAAAVDVNAIPIDLIERIDIQTGGASALYGADGVSGVVNFIMKRDFEGVAFRAQTGMAQEEGDADQHHISLVLGSNFNHGRGNAAAAFEFNNSARLPAEARDFAAGGARQVFVDNPALVPGQGALASQFGTFSHVPMNDVRFNDSSPDGAVYVSPDLTVDFNGSGLPFDAGAPFFIPPFLQNSGDGSLLDRFIGDLISGQKRYNANFFANYALRPRHRIFSQFKFVRTETETFGQPSFDYFLFIDEENPFIPASIRTALEAAPLTLSEIFGFPRGVLMSRDHFEAVRGNRIERETMRGVLGFEGALADRFDYHISYVYGKSDVRDLQINNRFNDRFGAALDAIIDPANGQPACRTNIDPMAALNMLVNFGLEPTTFATGPNSGCAPFNPFGEGSPSQSALDFVFQDTMSTSKITQHVVSGYVSGGSKGWFTLPAGPIGMIIGGEWRRETSRDEPNAFDAAGLTFGNTLAPEVGDFDVAEGFAEIDLPVVADLPGVQFFGFDAAVRFSDYTTVGATVTWKGGASWRVIDDLRFRGAIAQAVRAPNIGELFDPGGQTFQFIDDPCDIANLSQGAPLRAANCAAILGGLGVDPTTFVDPNSAAVPGMLRGNLNLAEEKARTYTLGAVLQPRFIPDLTLSADWYDISIENAIITALPQNAADLCVDSASIDNQFCARIMRDPMTGAIIDFVQQPLNVAQISTQGVDFAAAYQFDVASMFGDRDDWGVVNARLIGSRLRRLNFINFPGGDIDERLGESDPNPAPKWQLSFDAAWRRGSFSFNYGFTYFSRTLRPSDTELRNDPAIFAPEYVYFPARFTHDIQLRYEIGETYQVYVGVDNLADQEPAIGETFYPVGAVGRFVYAGFRMDFGAVGDLNPF